MTVSELPFPGDEPDAVRDVADRMVVMRSRLARVFDGLRDAGPRLSLGWHGQGAAACQQQVMLVRDGAGRSLDLLDAAGAALRVLAGRLDLIRREIEQLRIRWQANNFQRSVAEQLVGRVLTRGLLGAGLAIVGGGPDESEQAANRADLAAARRQQELCDVERDELLRRWSELVAEADAAVQEAQSRLAGSVQQTYPGLGGTVQVRLPELLGLAGVTADDRSRDGRAADPAAAWALLSPAQRTFYLGIVGHRPVTELTSRQQTATFLSGKDPLLVLAYLQANPELAVAPGMPSGYRDLGNRILLARDLTQARAELRDRGIDLAYQGDPGSPDNKDLLMDTLVAGGLSAERAGTIRGMLATDYQLRVARTALGPEVPVQLLIYQPADFGGQGRVAVGLGDVGTADHVAFLVPGMTADVPGYLDNQMSNGINLFGQAAGDRPQDSTAVVAAVSYDAPDVDWNVTTLAWAVAGATPLGADISTVSGLRAGSPSHLTVVSHSYGSTTAAQALRQGTARTDDFILLGSPGAGSGGRATDFGIGADHVWVGSASSDPVATLFQDVQNEETQAAVGGLGGAGAGAMAGSVFGPGGALVGGGIGYVVGIFATPVILDDHDLGQDPATEVFGGFRFHAETDSDLPWLSNHSQYYEPGSESLANISAIVTEQYDQVDLGQHRPGDDDHYHGSDPEADHEPG